MGFFSSLTARRGGAIENTAPVENISIIDIYAGGSGGAVGAVAAVMAPGQALYAALSGRPRLVNPVSIMADLDAGAKGLERAAVTEARLNTLAECDSEGAVFGHYTITNASISTRMKDSRGEQTCIRDMVSADDEEGRRLLDMVLTPEEADLPREVGGQGKPKITRFWVGTVMEVETMQRVLDTIVRAYLDGRRVLVRITGSATGATGATFLKALSARVYEACKSAREELLDNLRIHSIVIMGYAVHPGETEGGAFTLDATEDDLKTLYWYGDRQDSGVDKAVNRTYFVYAKPTVCYEYFARGGDQGRHYSLGDLLCMAAAKDSADTAFDGSRDGCLTFVPTPSDGDYRFSWNKITDRDFRNQCINYLRFCAAVYLKLRPLTLTSHEEIGVTPHAVKLLGKNPSADKIEEMIKPMQAMIGIAGEALEAFCDMGASGTDFSAQPVTYTADDTTVFNPYAIRRILDGRVEEEEINAFDPDELTEFAKGSGTGNVIESDVTVGDAYSMAVAAVGRGDTAVDFLMELYRALAI